MIIRTILAGIAGLAVAAGAAMAQPAQKVRIATEGAVPPYNYTEPNGTLAGFEIDLFKDLCARAKLECSVEAQAFDGMIPALNAGKFDAIMAGMSITPRREEAVQFSQPYASVGQIFMTLKSGSIGDLGDNGSIYSLANNEAGALAAIEKIKPKLKGKVIGVQTSTIGQAFLKQYLEGTVEIREYKTTEQHDLDLTAGRVDAVFASMAYLSESKKKLANNDVMITGPRFIGGLLGRGVGIAFRKSDTALKERFDAAIDAAKKEDAIKKLGEKYFGFDITPR